MNLKRLAMVLLPFTLLVSPVFGQAIEANQGIVISIQGVPDRDRANINGEYPVGQNGTINMPYIGAVRAAGLLPEQLAVNLQTQYQKSGIYDNPTFQVISNDIGRKIAQQTVTVGGDVRRPGPVAFKNGLTLWQALQAAGGETEFGSIKNVRLFRDGNMKEYDLRKPDQMQVPLRPDDTIQIQRKGPFG